MYTYRTVAGDTWDSVAYMFYQDEFYSTWLMKSNPKLLRTNRVLLPSGCEMNIPTTSEIKEMEEITTAIRKERNSQDKTEFIYDTEVIV